MQRDIMEYDVAIAGAGPAGLSAAIRLKQLSPSLKVCVLEKGSEPGAHIMSGAAFDPKALNELFPDWKERGAPLNVPIVKDKFQLLTRRHAIPLPVAPALNNHGCYIISLSNLTRWLSQQAEALGVEIFPGFPAAELVIESGRVAGVITGDMGRGKDGKEKPGFQPGVEIRAQQTLLAEGCRGHLSERVMKQFDMRQDSDPQTYGIGIKEIWEVEADKHEQGTVLHTIGWPLNTKTYGGSFVYHAEDRKISIGYIVGLDYENPYLDPFREFQRFKHHPSIAKLLTGGKRIAYGARAINEGGLQSLPKLTFPGGMLLGCAAGFLNVARIKGSHLAMKSGMLAAEAIASGSPESYGLKVATSWVHQELYAARNIRPGFHRFGLLGGMANAALDAFILRGNAKWTLHNRTPDHAPLKKASECRPIDYPKPDGVLSFDRMSSVFLSGTSHEEDQPVHLTLKDKSVPVALNLPEYDAPEQRYCPAGVYEIVRENGTPRLQINAANCVHCKTCDIKDPTQNIVWVTPEGGGGPNYSGM